MITVQPLTLDGVQRCIADLRDADREELTAAGIADAMGMMGEALPYCAWAEEAFWFGRPVFMYGVRPMAGGEIGVPWMLSTTALDDAERAAVARLARKTVARMRRDFPVLTNYVHRHNSEAIRFIEWLGFEVRQEFTGPEFAFRQFIWRRHV